MNQFNQWSFKLPEALQKSESGELLGKVFSLKDLIFFSPYPTTASTKAPIPKLHDWPLTEKLLDEGAVFAGKVYTHEIALGLFGWNPIGGQGLNPYDKSRISGGSSSGSAITVANKECDFSIGTDTGGSIRTPAAFCGIYSLKPTTGRISKEGVLPLSKTLDHIGIMARELPLIRKVFDVLKSDKANSPKRAKLKKIGIWDVENWVEPRVWAELIKFSDKLLKEGYQVERFKLNASTDIYSNISLYEAAILHREELAKENPQFGELTLTLLRRGQAITDESYNRALKERVSLQEETAQLFKSYDYLLAPTVPCPAPHIQTQQLTLPEGEVQLRQSLLRLTCPWSVIGIPVVNIPLPLDGLFVGAQVMGPMGFDEELLEFCCGNRL